MTTRHEPEEPGHLKTLIREGYRILYIEYFFGVLTFSQFTLYGLLKGNKPDFHVAMPPDKAKPFYESVVDRFRKSYRTDAIKGILQSSSLLSLLCLAFASF